MDKDLQKRNRVDTLHQHIINLQYLTKVGITSTSKRLVKQKLRNYYEKLWKNKLMLSTRGKYFKSFKQNILFETYLALLPQRNLRLSLTKLRLSDHRLMIESGRRCKPKTPLQERIFPLCNDGSNKSIEDEVYFLFSCNWRKSKQLIEKFFDEIINIVRNFGDLDSKQKFMYIIGNENKTILTKFAIFISLVTKEHDIAMTL